MLGPEWQYHITIHNPDWITIEHWCDHYIGKFDQAWYKLGIDPAESVMTGEIRTTWYFKNEKDVILFKLRWA
jgi:hypothetical protein